MISKYDRIEDMERARMEGPYGYSEYFWGSQPHAFQQPWNVPQYSPQIPYLNQLQGFQQPFTPYSQYPVHPQFLPWFQGLYGLPFQQQQFTPQVAMSRAFRRPPRNYKRPDELIRDEICKRLTLTQEIDATEIEVIVKDGEVTLRGIVDDRFAKRIVEDIAETTFGIRDVLNEVRIGSRFLEHELTGTTKGKEK